MGKEMGNDELASFAGATGDDDAFGHDGGCEGGDFIKLRDSWGHVVNKNCCLGLSGFV